jgi:N-acetyl-anhydromuramyl-L-alanine amidase AmpD
MTTARTTTTHSLAIAVLSIATFASACDQKEAPDLSVGLDIFRSSEVSESSSLALTFEAAAEEHGVPVDVLKALAYTETGFEGALGEVEFEGQDPAYGMFALRGAELDRALSLSGHTLDELVGDPAVDIDAAAALLASYAEESAMTAEERAAPLFWKPALKNFGSLSEDLREHYADTVLNHLAGVAVPMNDGTTMVIDRHIADGAIATNKSGLGQAGTIWRPSPNVDSRNGRSPHFVIIHTCEGGYWGCVDWLRQPVAGVSAHYVVKEDGSEISQLVDENSRAWHVGQVYRDWLNENSHPEYQGVGVNSISIGIEHGGFASQSSWPQAQINASVELVRGIITRWDLPPDRYHIVAHGRLQPESRSDPGPNWPWTSYLAAIAQGSNPMQPTEVLTVDNSDASRFRASGNWQSSSWASGRIGGDYRFRGPQAISDSADYKVNITVAGNYEVFVRSPGNGYNTNAPYVIHHRGGRSVVHRDMSAQGAAWVSLGTFAFDAQDEWIVQLSCWTNGTGWIIADAVKLEQR